MDYKEFNDCGLKRSFDLLSGKWKPLILFHLFSEKKIRFIELWKQMPRVSKKVLVEQLKQLQEQEIIVREKINNYPPEVYYKIHPTTAKIGPALLALENWGKNRRLSDETKNI